LSEITASEQKSRSPEEVTIATVRRSSGKIMQKSKQLYLELLYRLFAS